MSLWDDVPLLSRIHPQVLIGILQAGLQTLQGALALSFMSRGYRQGLIRYGLLKGTKT